MDSIEKALAVQPTVVIGGLTISAINRPTAADIMIRASHGRRGRPLYFTSANGEVIARARGDRQIAAMFSGADQIVADGQPLVIASRFLCRIRLPERIATTDLFHDVARLAERSGETFYFLGGAEAENRKAAEVALSRYPGLKIVGRSHGYLSGNELDATLAEIDALGPDILWLGLGVPREQIFVRDCSAKLPNVGLVKTAGGLFDHLSGKNRRAPLWMQKAGFEWLWRMMLEPRRLFWRYLTTNPRAFYAILRHSQ